MFGKIGKQESTLTSKKQILQRSKTVKQRKQTEKFDQIVEKQMDKLQGSSFRMLNELLYSSQSQSALAHFTSNPDDFQQHQYHRGYQSQVKKWPENPVEQIIHIIEHLKSNNMLVCDLGCGDGQIHEHFTATPSPKVRRVMSYDLMATKPFVKAVDIAKLPRKDQSADVCVFSLSLMGLNYLQFLIEAFRVMRKGGFLIIAEVISRMNTLEQFTTMVELIGFKLYTKNAKNTHFVLLVFRKVQDQAGIVYNRRVNEQHMESLKYNERCTYGEFSQMVLQPCLYKKR